MNDISHAGIPAKPGIQLSNTGFRVEPGMTNKIGNVSGTSLSDWL